MAEPLRATSPVLRELSRRLEKSQEDAQRREGRRPFITLAYAQSLDGSIAGKGHRPLRLSGAPSLQLTHELRAAHDAILVGIGTVVTDNPRLNVRLVPGTSPRPIIVDSRLRTPETSRLLETDPGTGGSWLATTDRASEEAAARLTARGAEVLRIRALENGWVDLGALMTELCARGTSHLLVEGGARILTSFLESRLADHVVLTVAPRFVGGLAALTGHELTPCPRLTSWQAERFGDDLVLGGELCWSEE